MPGAWHKPGNLVRFEVPDSHVVGHEQADNPDGPRPWLITFSRFVSRSGLVVGVPLATKAPVYGSEVHLPLEIGDVDTSGCASPLGHDGYVFLDQVRALSIERAPNPQVCGRVKRGRFDQILEELAAMFSTIR